MQLLFEIDSLYETHNLSNSEHSRPPPRNGAQPVNTFCSLLEGNLDDAIAQLKYYMDVLKCVQSELSTSAMATPPVQSKPAAFMTT